MTKEKTSILRIVAAVGVVVGIASTILGFVFGSGKSTAQTKMQVGYNTKEIVDLVDDVDYLEKGQRVISDAVIKMTENFKWIKEEMESNH